MSQTKVKSGLLNFPDQTDFVKLPSGTTAQRPVSPEKGYSRYNTTDNKLEFWNGTEWQQLPGVVAPIITSVSYPGDDLAADPAGGQTITINGSDFKTGATVTVGGTIPSVITFVSATEITFEAPAKAAGDYDLVVTNLDGGNATSVNGMSYNGVPSWTTPAGNLGTFPAGSTIPTITLVATEPDSGVINYSVTTGALPSGLVLTGADIDGNVPTPAGETTYNFSVTASDDENQSTERAFNIVVYLQVTNTVSEVDPFGDSSGLALYKLDGDATDESGNYNGTEYNTPSYGSGIFGQGYSNNGSNKYILLPRIITTNFSWSFWVKFNSLSNARFFGVEGGIVEPDLIFQIINGSLSYYGGSSVGTNILMSSPQTDNWYHIVAVSGSGVYVNGNFYPESGLSQPSSGGNIGIGSDGIDIGEVGYLNGSIDQVRIFNRALTPLEVSSLYEERTVVCGGQAETVDILGDNSCIALYPLDGNANDLSGNYSGTPTNVSYGVGEFDLAGVFNGSSSKILVPSPSYPLGSSPRSVSCWVKSTNTTANQTLLQYGTGGVNNNFFVFRLNGANNSSLEFSQWGPAHSVSAPSIFDGNFHNVVMTYNGSFVQFYLDGSPLGSTYSASLNTQAANAGIGAYADGAVPLDGSIDQVRMFNKALSAGEVTTLYNETACDVLACSGTTNTLDILGDSSCIAAYPLDGSPADLSGNYNGVQTDVTYPVGKYDLGGSFNGSSSKITTNVDFDGGTLQGGSISFWFKTSSTASQNPIGSQTALDGGGYGSVFYLGESTGVYTDESLAFWHYDNGQAYAVFVREGNTAYQNGEWFHCVMTSTSTTKNIYINGVDKTLSYRTNTTSSTPFSLTNIQLGISLGTSAYFNGSIDQVRIFNKALTSSEVTTLYNETACN